MKVLFKKIRRDVCRYIMSFERCPISYRKDYKRLFLDGLFGVALCAMITMVGLLLIITFM